MECYVVQKCVLQCSVTDRVLHSVGLEMGYSVPQLDVTCYSVVTDGLLCVL